MAKIRFKSGFNVYRVVSKITSTVIGLWVGGTILTEVGNVMNGTTSAFYKGLSLIGWTVSATNQITDTTGGSILSVVGIIAIASIVLEFIEFRM